LVPLRDENPTELTPFITVIFIVLNVLAWVFIQGMGSPQALEASVYVFGTVPCELTGACPTEGLGWSGIFTSMFMHGSWGHLLGNMLFLWVFGNNIEDSMGHLRFIVFYFVCGVAAGLAHVYLSPASPIPAVGASGAISGVMGAYIVLYPRVKVRTWVPPFFLLNLKSAGVLAGGAVTDLSPGMVEAALRNARGLGFDDLAILDVINYAAFFANANRLMLTLGEPKAATRTGAG